MLGVIVGLALITWAVVRLRADRRRQNTGVILLLGIGVLWPSVAQLVYWVDRSTGTVLGFGVLIAVLVLVFGTAGALVVNGYYVMKREGISVAHSLPLVLGLASLAVFAYGFYHYSGVTVRKFSWLDLFMFWYVAVMGYVGFNLAAYSVQALIHGRWPSARTYDAVVVLGAGLNGELVTPLLASRLDRGIGIARQSGARRLVCSGGQGPDEVISEAEAMARYVRGKLEGEAIEVVKEDQSTTTEENLRLSSALLGDAARVAVATSNYHALRAGSLARKLGLAWNVFGAPTAPYYVPTAFLREFAATMRLQWRVHAVMVALITVAFVLLSL